MADPAAEEEGEGDGTAEAETVELGDWLSGAPLVEEEDDGDGVVLGDALETEAVAVRLWVGEGDWEAWD